MRIAILMVILAGASVARAETPSHEPGAVVFVIDRSGSTYDELAIEKQAVITAIGALDPGDHVGVVAYNNVAVVVFDDVVAQRAAIKKPLREVTAEGGTKVAAGLRAAFELVRTSTAKRKHVIMLSDGSMDDEDLDDLLATIRDAGVTISTVGIGDAHRDLMARIALASGGRFSMVRKLGQLAKVLTNEAQRGRR